MAAFKNRSMRVGTSTPQETPYLKAAQEWDRRIGDSRVQAASWRFMAFACLGVAAIFAVGFVMEANRVHITAYYVPVDNAGKPGQVELADNVYNPTQAEIGYFLGDWVTKMFSKPVDPIVMKTNMQSAFAYLVGHGLVTVTNWAQQTDPTKNMGHQAVTVNVSDVLQRSPDTYQVDWTQTSYEDGAVQTTQNFTGLFQITIHQPTNQAQLLSNPLGIYITELSWSRQT
jgi:type IV secretion system protein VirB5